MPYLVTDGEARPIGHGVLTVGSGTEASWRIVGKGLRPIHAVLVMEADGSTNVTPGDAHAQVLVNGEALRARTRIQAGDVLELGEVRFTMQAYRSPGGGGGAFLRDINRNRIFKLDDHNLIGRDQQCRVMLSDPDVSRRHAEISRENELFYIRPASPGLTMVNGERLADRRALTEGDEVSIGRTTLRFSRETPTLGTSVEPATPGRPAAKTSKMQTTFFGAVEIQDRLERDARRRAGLLVLAAVVLIATLVLIFH